MPTIFTHPAVPLALGLGLGSSIIPRRLLVLGVVASILPDLDVLAFKLGVSYASALGHRGFSHSILFALLIALLGAITARIWRAPPRTTFAFLCVVTLSHTLLDAVTNGGLGVALFWPISAERFFAPWQVIQVSPFGLRFFSARGVRVILSELLWVWLPAFVLYLNLLFTRRLFSGQRF